LYIRCKAIWFADVSELCVLMVCTLGNFNRHLCRSVSEVELGLRNEYSYKISRCFSMITLYVHVLLASCSTSR